MSLVFRNHTHKLSKNEIDKPGAISNISSYTNGDIILNTEKQFSYVRGILESPFISDSEMQDAILASKVSKNALTNNSWLFQKVQKFNKAPMLLVDDGDVNAGTFITKTYAEQFLSKTSPSTHRIVASVIFQTLPQSSHAPTDVTHLANKAYVDKFLSKEDTDQTVAGLVTFSKLPQSSVTPTTGNQLTNKTYVDAKITSEALRFNGSVVTGADLVSFVFTTSNFTNGTTAVFKGEAFETMNLPSMINSTSKGHRFVIYNSSVYGLKIRSTSTDIDSKNNIIFNGTVYQASTTNGHTLTVATNGYIEMQWLSNSGWLVLGSTSVTYAIEVTSPPGDGT